MNSAIRKVAKESNPDKQAERQIERLADLQSDVQAWPKTREDKVRDIVREDLQQRLDLGLKVRDKIRAAWKGVLRQKLIDAGVKEGTAERLTDIVWRQHEINYLNRKMKDVEMAVTRGPIAPIVNAIKNTPLSQQQDPKWKRKVAYEYLVNAGLDKDTAGRVADLMDLTLQKVFVRAQEKAFTDIVGRKLDTPNSRRQMQRFLQAIRAGALDPTKNLTSEIAAQNGWTGFTSEQVAKLNELDTIVNDPKALDLQRSTAFKEIQDILKTSKLDPTVTETLSAYYTAQALSGVPTTTVNIFSAVGFSMRNAMTDTMRLAATNPSALPAVFDTFISSWKTYASEVIYSFKNNVQRRGTVEYLSNDDALLRLYNKGKRQWNEGKRSEGFKNMLFGMMEYVGRWLKALDEGAVSVLEQQGLTRYAMMAMKQAGISSKDANAAANYVQSQKQQFIVNAVAKGMNKTEAKALSDDVFRGAWIEALSNLKIDSQEVLDSALNDSLSAIGRMNNTFDQLRQETRDIKDNGFVSSLPIGLLERLGEAMNSPSATEGQRIFYRMVYGFAVVPARVMREAAWYSPYGFVRFAIDAFAKGRGKGSPYAQSLGTDLQFRQRLTETIAGSIVLGALMALSQGSVDDPEDESPFKIVVTGNGPERRLDPQFHDAFFKKYSRNALHVFIGKTKFKINIERGFEAFAIPFMLAGAIDDWRIRKRFEQSKKTPSDLSDASILLGSAFLSFSRRGPFAAYMDGIVSSRNSDEALTSLGSFLTFTGKTFVPIAGTSLARNISDFVSDPVERRSMEGALWANTPVIGPMMGTKSMNALGETTGAGELSDRFYKLGVPIVFNLPGTPEQTKLRDLIIEKGQGPDIPTRYDARRALGFEPTDQQFERYITAYGQYMKQRMLENYTSLDGKTPVKYVEQLQVYQKTARLRAKQAVTKNISQP
jgi:polyhydroxyalkanoate synthesis regulator phasin